MLLEQKKSDLPPRFPPAGASNTKITRQNFPSRRNPPCSLLQKGHHLLFRGILVTNVHEVPGQQVIALAHQVGPYMQEVNAVKHNGIVADVVLDGTAEIIGVFRPVHGGFDVMADVVAIVPAFVVVLGIDAGNAVLVGIAGVFRANKGMLRPVAQHHHNARYYKGNNEHYQRGRPVYKAHAHAEGHKEKFPAHGAHQQLFAFLAHKIAGQVINAGKEEAAQVCAKPADGVPLKAHGAAFVFRQVIFRVMHANMVTVVSFRRLAKERAQYPGKVVVHEIVLLPEKGAVAGTVQHKTEGAFENKIVENEIGCSQYAPPPAGNEGHVQQHGQHAQHQRNTDGQVHKRQVPFITNKTQEKTVYGRFFNWLPVHRV